MSNDHKAIATLVVAASLVLGMVIWGSAGTDIRPNVAGGFFTLAAAGLAAFVVFWQLRKQAENTNDANRRNEVMKLKKELYTEVFKTVDDAMAALDAIDRHVLEGWAELKEFQQLQEQGQLPQPHPRPEFSLPKLQEKYEAVAQAMKRLAALPRKWVIVEPKILIFKPAFDLASQLRGGSFARLLTASYRAFTPFDGQQPWRFEQGFVTEYEQAMSSLRRETRDERGYVEDFLVAMQNALLGGLFGEKVDLRQPANPNTIVIDIEKPQEVLLKLSVLRKSTGWFDTSQY